MTVGIYAICRIGSNDRYVGQSVNIEKRWGDHRRLLEAGKSHSPALQEAWNYYGEQSFTFVVLEECSEDDLDAREQFHMRQASTLNHNTPYTEPLAVERKYGLDPNDFDLDLDLAETTIQSADDLKSQLEALVGSLVECEKITENIEGYLLFSEFYDDKLVRHCWDSHVDGNELGSANVVEILRRIEQLRA